MMPRGIKILLLLLAVTIAVVYYLDYHGRPFFEQLTVDELYHDQSADAIAHGALTATEPFFRAPFYSYFLGLVFALSGSSVAVARLIQLLLGALLPLLTYLVAGRLFSRNVAVIAALLTLLCGDLIYFSGELLLESLLAPLLLVGWLLYANLGEKQSLPRVALLGLLAGCLIVTRPNMVIFALAWLPAVLRAPRADNSSGGGRRVASYLALLLLPISLTLLHNLSREDPALTLATQGGINFYLGNNRAADGASAVMPDRSGYAWQFEDLRYLAETETGKSLTAAEVSGYYYRQGLAEIRADPVGWLGLLLRKTYLFFSALPLSNNRDLGAFWQNSAVLRFLPIGMWFLGPLGLVGMLIGWRHSPQARAMVLGTLLYSASFILFFVNSRFRAPILPLLAIFAAQFLVWGWRNFSARHWRKLLIGMSAALFLLLVANLNIYHLSLANRAQEHFSRGNFLLRQGDHPAAIEEYREALEAEPHLTQVRLNLGVAYLRSGQPDSAQFYFLAEDSLTDGNAAALSNLSFLARRQGKPVQALDYARRAFALKPYLEDARLNLWHAWRAGGHSDSAFVQINRWRRSHELSPQEQLLLAASALDLGRATEAIPVLRRLLNPEPVNLQPEYAELSQPPRLLGALDSVEFARLVHYNLGTAYGQLGDLDSAVIQLRAAVAIDPSFSEGWINLASALMSQSKLPAAEEALHHAEALGAYLVTVYFNLALTSLRQTDTSAARQYLRQSLESDSTFAPARQLLSRLQ